MKLIVITEPDANINEHKIIEALFKAGMQVLHVRKPGFNGTMMADFLEKIPHRYHKKIVVHSHYHLVGRYKLKGLHLPESKRTMTFVNRILFSLRFIFNKIQVSASFHKLEHLNGNVRKYKYVFFSPVFESISKENHRPKYSLRMIYNKLSKMKAGNVIALGGVDDTKISLSKDAGFSGVAILGYIWQSDDPVKSFLQLSELCKQEEKQY